MARARNIKPGFYKNEVLAECSIWARFIYPGLWTQANRRGRLEDRPLKLKAELLAYDSKNMDKLLQELHDHGFILRYEVDGRRLIQVLKFKKHQNPHHEEKDTLLPEPPADLLKSLGLVLTDEGYEPGVPDLLNTMSELGPTRGKPGGNLADSLNPITDSLNPDSGIPRPESLSGQPSAAPGTSAERTRPTREAYSQAYRQRWNVAPVFDRQANAMIKQFVDKLGTDEAPLVAAFYCTHNRQDYIRAKHDVNLMLRDARGLRTEWATGRQVTDAEARQADKSAGGFEQVNRLLADARKH